MIKFIQSLAATVSIATAGYVGAADLMDQFVQVQPSALPMIPDAVESEYPAGRVEQGHYLVGLLGCGSCHSDGALIGQLNAARLLAGSSVGIATSSPLEKKNPGVVYPANLTPDQKTGIGDWTLEQIVTMLQSGRNNHGEQTLPVMPWLTYAKLREEDAMAIAMYLKSIPPVEHQVPAAVRSGRRASAPFVYFGIYRSRP